MDMDPRFDSPHPDPSDRTLDQLPDLPQLAPLRRLAPRLWRRPEVLAMWLGGSLARGGGDAYSDVDLRLGVRPEALEGWRAPDFGELFEGACVGHQYHAVVEEGCLHILVLDGGAIYDLWIQATAEDTFDEPPLVLGCRDAAYERLLAAKADVPPPGEGREHPPAEAEGVRRVLEDFWINSHKHAKILHRGLDLASLTGVLDERGVLLRLWYILATGRDSGQRPSSIFRLAFLHRALWARFGGERVLAVLGAPLSSPAELHRGVETLRDEIAGAGRELARRLGFPYPHALEATVRRGWREFLSGSPATAPGG